MEIHELSEDEDFYNVHKNYEQTERVQMGRIKPWQVIMTVYKKTFSLKGKKKNSL